MSSPLPPSLPWVSCGEIAVCTAQVKMYSNNVVWGGTHLSPAYGAQPDTWVEVDLKPLGVPVDAKAAFLSGILIITNPAQSEIADMRITFARPSDPDAIPTDYIGQTCIQGDGGQRSNMACWVPLENGSFKFFYHVTSEGSYPDHPCYGVNLSVQAWVR